jgi:glycosyltransferase involved in cell wall biosynthesis
MHRKTAKTKVLYIITKSNWGGAQRYVYDIATNISKNNYEAVVALGENQTTKSKASNTNSLKEKLENAGIRTISIPNLVRDINIFSELKVFFDLLKILKKEKPNVAHLNSSKIGGLGAFAVRIHNILPQNKILKANKLMKLAKLKARIIFTAHGWAYKEDRNIVSKKILFFLSWLTIIFSHKTIVVSEDDYKNAPKLFVNKKIVMIHNGISEIKFEDRDMARKTITARQGLTVDKNTVWIGTISELYKNKGLSFVIRAIYQLIKRGYNISFFIIGEGEEWLRLNLLIKKLKLENNVFLLGHIDNASELLKAFDIFTLTSIKEGLPYVLLEAGLAGLPTVATHTGGIPEIIENRKSGRLVQTKNSHAIENAISDMINFKKDATQYGNTLKEKVEQDFTLEQMTAETINLYP